MNWRVGLLRLWVVGTAFWILSLAAFQWASGGNPAAELSTRYLYYHVIRPDLVAEKRQFLDPKSPHYCVLQEQRERQKSRLAELEAAVGKADAVRATPPHTLTREEVLAILKDPEPDQVVALRTEIQRVPVCSAEVATVLSALEDVDVDFPDRARDALLTLAYLLFAPPLAVLFVGTALLWALRGFRVR